MWMLISSAAVAVITALGTAASALKSVVFRRVPRPFE
jgi:hypothetical protein